VSRCVAPGAGDGDLSEADRRFVLSTFAEPRGFYGAGRAAQLSGVPERTIYYWARTKTLVPDHGADHPMAWSYRDLVFLRLVAFLRRRRVDLPDAANVARRYRRDFSRGKFGTIDTSISAAQGGYAYGDTMPVDELSGQQAFEIMADISSHFDLLAPLDDGKAKGKLVEMRGPNLLRPSERTSISPWIMSGEPVVRNSRITTATLLALRDRRRLNPQQITELYPTLTRVDVEDAIEMERDLRSAA
jgi:uncharacterized protein (DUF433 family)